MEDDLSSRLCLAFVGMSGVGYAPFLRALLVVGLAIAAQSHSPAEPRPQKQSKPPLQAETDLVVMRAIFVDSRGRRITNLTADDIIVKDDGEVQKLSTFEAPSQHEKSHDAVSSGHSAQTSTFAATQNGQALEVLILLPGMGFTNRYFALQAVAKYLESKHDGLTRVAVADASGAALRFTPQDQEMSHFARSLLKLSIPPVGFESWRFRQSAVRLCESMKEMPGKKAIVLLSDFYRFPNPYNLGTQPDDVLSIALDIGAAVYTVDTRGVMPVIPFGDASSAGTNFDTSGQSFALMTEQGELADIASETGGDFVPGNDLGAAFKEMERDASSSYFLEYYKDGLKHDGAFHSIKIVSKRRGIHVRARKGYFAPIKGLNEMDSNSQLRMALASDYLFHDVRIRFRPYFFPSAEPGQSFTVTILGLEFGWASKASDSLLAGPLSILGTILAPGNRAEDFSNESVPRVVSEPGTLPTYYLESTVQTPAMRLPSGDNVIKVAARAATGELGSAVLRLPVPEQQTMGIRISSLLISRQADTVKAPEQGTELSNPLIAGDVRVVPQISNRFRAGENLIFFARVAGNDNKTPLAASISVKELSGVTLVGPISTELRGPGDVSPFGIPVLFSLPASDFAHGGGQFVAELTIKQQGGKVVGSESAAFAITRENEGGNAN